MEFSISATVTSLADGKVWMVSSVYGPQADQDKVRFLAELETLGEQVQAPWILNGDFNLVRHEEERSTGRANRSLVNKFRHTNNKLVLDEMPLVGRKFTWCNG